MVVHKLDSDSVLSRGGMNRGDRAWMLPTPTVER